jgi:glycosyltransferase involved in cell wall biosynthesis
MSHATGENLPELEIVIPVYNEGVNIVPVLRSLNSEVKTPFRVLLGYDRDDDDTLVAIEAEPISGMNIVPVKNLGKGALGAVVTCFEMGQAPAVLVFPADDDYNASRIDGMVAKLHQGCDIVCASRFMPGGCMVGCPPLKNAILRSSAFVLHRLARLPTHDPSNGLRMFSRRVLARIPIESDRGFTYSIELLVKAHRLGWRICEVPFAWYERKRGRSRFRVIRWLPAYFRWFSYAFATLYLRRGAETVRLRASERSVPT